MDSSQWPQGIGVARAVDNNSHSRPSPGVAEKKPRPPKEHALNCPRCSSTNTKFCYYNNYSLSQPRYFCKNCRRYWTEGGSLRNVPVGGGSRKNKRSSSSASSSLSSSSSSKKMVTDLGQPSFLAPNPKIHQGQDLNLAYNPSHYSGISEYVALPFGLQAKNLNNNNNNSNNSSVAPASNLSAMELLKNGNMTSFMPIPVSGASNPMYSSGFPVHELKSSLGFSLDGLDQNLYGSINMQGVEGHHANQSRMLFPFEELKPASASGFGEDNRGQNEANGYWNGMLAGGSW